VVLKRTTISGCDAGIYTSGAGGLFLMGSSTCTNSLTYGAYLGSACRWVRVASRSLLLSRIFGCTYHEPPVVEWALN
jgi:hypothetical protein